jgi:hypothetical protein
MIGLMNGLGKAGCLVVEIAAYFAGNYWVMGIAFLVFAWICDEPRRRANRLAIAADRHMRTQALYNAEAMAAVADTRR